MAPTLTVGTNIVASPLVVIHKFLSAHGIRVIPIFLALIFSADFTRAGDNSGAAFDGNDTLIFPKDYREWVFVGSSLGLEYDGAEPKSESDPLEFKNVYMNRSAYREYLKTRKFPDGTILVLETGTASTKREPGLRGSFLEKFRGVSAAVKDTKRFPDGWAYFGFKNKDGTPADRARPFAKVACYDCHKERGANDNVFTQFYPILGAVSEK